MKNDLNKKKKMVSAGTSRNFAVIDRCKPLVDDTFPRITLIDASRHVNHHTLHKLL